jgi:hypothetical protein
MWVLASTKLQLLQPSGEVKAVVGLPVAAGSMLASGGGSSVVVAGPKQIRWLVCSCAPLVCSVTATVAVPPEGGQMASAAATSDGRKLWLGTDAGLYLLSGPGAALERLPNISGAVHAVAASADGAQVAASTLDTVFWLDAHHAPAAWQHIGVGGVIDSAVTSLGFLPAALGAGGPQALAIGTQTALHVLGTDGRVRRISGLQGLPWNNITAIAQRSNDGHAHRSSSSSAAHSTSSSSSLWLGTTMGLVQLLNPLATLDDTASLEWRYYYGPRWLLGDTVAAVAAPGAGGGVWAVTEVGVALIKPTPMTLLRKAAHYQELMDSSSRHDRYGLVATVPLAKYGAPDSAVPTDGDNDGSSTAYYMASQIFRWRVTQDPAAKRNAWHHFGALEFLHI